MTHGTGITSVHVPLCFRSSCERMLQSITNFGIRARPGTLNSTREETMTAEFPSATSGPAEEPFASRRDFVAAAVTVAAAAGGATAGGAGAAQAQAAANVRYSN